MPKGQHGPSIKNDETYDALRDKGYSKEKAARITNAQETGNSSATTAHQGKAYEEWSKDELYQKAQDVGIDGRSDMTKDELIDALRNH